MSDHFAAFSFVDRIVAFEPGARARGTFAIPAGIAAFPGCLVAEAVGQLAAWVAMAHIDFRGRPVAALARETRFHGAVAPGDTLVLDVEIGHCDDEAVSYRGTARVGDALRIELDDCLGPMLPVADFDDPEALRARLALLTGPGAPPGRFRGVPAPELTDETLVPGASARATLHVPTAAPFFADHFPRRPVFPATLLLEAQMELALRLAATAPQFAGRAAPRPDRMTNVKVRSFTAPGALLALTAEMTALGPDRVRVAMTALAGDRTTATSRFEAVVPGARP